MNHLLPFPILASLLFACGPDLPEVDCTAPVPTYGEVTVFTNGTCNLCHVSTATGPARMNAPTGIDYDTYAAAVMHAEAAAEQVHGGTMPPAGFESIAPDATERDLLYRWALCGTPP